MLKFSNLTDQLAKSSQHQPMRYQLRLSGKWLVSGQLEFLSMMLTIF